MNQREIVDKIGSVVTDDNMKKAVALAATVNPVAGAAAAIVGAIIVRGVVSAQEYIKKGDEAPLIPPHTPYIMSYTDSLVFLEEHNLTVNFQDTINGANPESNPANYEDCENEIMDAASFIRMAIDKDDPIYNAFYFGYIRHKKYWDIWDKRGKYWEFKEKLELALPPAEFTSLSEAIWDGVTDDTSKKEMIGIIKDAAKEYMGDVSLEDVLKIIS